MQQHVSSNLGNKDAAKYGQLAVARRHLITEFSDHQCCKVLCTCRCMVANIVHRSLIADRFYKSSRWTCSGICAVPAQVVHDSSRTLPSHTTKEQDTAHHTSSPITRAKDLPPVTARNQRELQHRQSPSLEHSQYHLLH